MVEVRWDRFPQVGQNSHARSWLTIQADLGLAANTVKAYGRALEDYFSFARRSAVEPDLAARATIAGYVHDLTSRASSRGSHVRVLDSGAGLANATLQQRLTAVRLYYDYLVEEGLRLDNPVGRGRYAPGRGFGGVRDRGLIPRYEKLPWIPTDEQWRAILEAALPEPIRNRFMLALTYDAALRREELCALEVGDIDPSYRLLRVRAERTKSRRERVVPYSEPTSRLFAAYLADRRQLSQERGPLFRSTSDRNRAAPVSIWTWSKVVRTIAERARVLQFTTHTPRHLRLTDLARADWDVQAIATFAGHRNIQSTFRYIHLSGRELATKLEKGMAQIHAWRTSQLTELLP
jgi:integrase/recombinase XerD